MASTSYERSGPAAVLTITRRERRNAIDGQTAQGLLAGFRAFEADEDARVLIIAGEGPEAFCAGADLKAIETIADLDSGPLGFTRLTASKPTVAAISGWCLAGGLELALWCDLRIATGDAQLGFTERRFGVPLIDGGTQRLPRIVGQGRALDMILTGRIVGAQEALQMGLVTELVDEGAHLDRALELAANIAAFPQDTMLGDRRSMLEGAGRPFSEGLALERAIGTAVLHTTAVEGAGRFASGEGRGGQGAGA
ncbi:MAG: crotonase/enoyl-CoA hydratase family protein [Solirubrobacterales bacterium]